MDVTGRAATVAVSGDYRAQEFSRPVWELSIQDPSAATLSTPCVAP